ncbi:PD-(D/E)XK nuclease family protein [Collinsella sp. TM10-22]|uniref:PD-(D/E)XK nuclease family protein n=1 Tax=unclassified Collinsella TaxID=2637548 RepID=UPI000E546533|nr:MULTISPECIES: PD-(D/E)XK nuclease family protein [unclassified Collinsella]RGI68143.1 PD-(D/E)XK nuclease family protein [Collinsella sp. TM10-22]RHJ38757.1 PD-(D/E)XK nuclease family protein [Collinsella sp. AM10-48]RHJ38940.1 PD-(D/E)XK nuclease family protein [Collinsella sp. AM10-32]RHJ44484.1 PD-(D/E)XK nuclease family protein [Collinsella sp. AM10-26]RHJ45276.1 PD-(D/E)XK nuclease family protein [Collinsella sp. AM10-27]
MPVRIYTTNAGADLSDAEAALLADLVARHGRAVLLVPTFAELDLCRHDAAEAGVSLGIDYKTPSSWLRSLWELMGDGRSFVDNLQCQMLFSDMIDRRDDAALQPLSRSQGTVRMLARMARDVLPGVAGAGDERCRDAAAQPEPKSDAEARVFELLRAYAGGLDRRNMIEPCEAADIMAGALADNLPGCARAVCVRGVTSFTYSLLELLSAVANNGGEVVVLLVREQAATREELAAAFDARGVLFEIAPLDEDAGASDAACGTAAQPAFIEVAGPHARAHVYADAIDDLVKACQGSEADGAATNADPARVLVVSARAPQLFGELASRLAARRIAAETTEFTAFSQSIAGRQLTALAGLIERMKAADEGIASKTEWWPAPELTDWIYSPLSGADAASALTFDKNMRLSRSKTTAGVKSLLQSIQGQVRGARKAASDENWFKNVPCVVSDVFQALWRDKPVTALKAMLAVAEALPDRSLGSLDGQARRQAEVALLRHVIDILMNDARALDVSQAATVPVLDGVRTKVDKRSTAYDYETYEVDRAPRAQVRFASLADASVLRPGCYDAVLFADVDLDSYPLSHEEGPLATLTAELRRDGVSLEPAALLRVRFCRAMQAASGPVALARVTHDRQARECYPAAVWTELRAYAEAAGAAKVACVGEGGIVADFDPAAGEGIECKRVACEAPQHLSDAAVPYLVLCRRDGEGEDAPLVPRLTSASQIEAYSTCPLCWFVSYRVKPQSIDAGFGNMEKGNFVHDVLERLHARLPQEGMERVTPMNLPRAQELLHEVFDETLAEHASKRGNEGPLVPLSPVEERQVAEILPQLEGVLAYESEALAPFAPRYLEFAFNELKVEYAGWPLGGRIDRVDVDAENRAVVIDYKHRTGVEEFKLADPTVRDEESGEAAIDDPRWLPPHTQTLIYAQAMRRALDLDTRAALYFSTKGGKPALRGAASAELLEEERGDGRIPGLKKGFPGEGGSMDFDALLDRVEAGIAERLRELEAGNVAAVDPTSAQAAHARCSYNHEGTFVRRDV